MLKQVLFAISYMLLLFVSFSCVSGQQYKGEEFITSKIYPALTCKSDTSLTYALFLPPQYEKGKPCPVLILFDPHGDGLLPVNLFSVEAAKSGFIITGSNNSKNGMPVEQTTAICRKMIAELTDRFTIEKKAIYLGGFSGGSRVAGAGAISLGGVAGVVGCGAGLPGTNQNPVNPFSYLAVVGSQDFNFTEMKQLDRSLEQAGYQHHLLVFDGIHQWPPKEIIPDIFAWLRFDAMRQQAIASARTEINNFIEKNDKTAGDFSSKGNLPMQLDTYIKMMHYLQGLTDVAPLQAEINRLSGEKAVIANKQLQTQLLELEQELQQKYAPRIEQQNTEWWSKETSILWAQTKEPGKPEMNQVYSRLLGYLSLNSYMHSNNALKQGDLPAAERYIEIYRLVDPANAEHRYLAAKVAALNHNPDAVFSALKQAFDLGFKDISRLRSDIDLKPFQSDERFKILISGK